MSIHNKLAFVIYLTLFFVYFIYSFAVLNGFPNFLGGMFSLSVIIFFPLVFLKYIINLKRESNLIEWFYFFLLFYVLSYSIIAASFLNMALSDPPVLKGLLLICYSLVGWYIGRFLILENYIFRNINHLCIIFIAGFFLMNIIAEGNIFAILFILLDDSGIASTYQGIGRSIFFIGIFTLLFSKKHVFTLFLSFILLIFLVGSRTHIIGFVSIFFFYLLLTHPKSSLITLSFLIAAISAILSIINIYFPELYDVIVTSRISELFNLASSASASARMQTFASGWELIGKYPIFGSFGYYFYNGTGYPHNFLYAWSNWGFLPFLLILGIFFIALFKAFINVLSLRSHVHIMLVSYVITVFILYIFLLEPIEDVSLGIMVGLLVGIVNEKHKNYTYL